MKWKAKNLENKIKGLSLIRLMILAPTRMNQDKPELIQTKVSVTNKKSYMELILNSVVSLITQKHVDNYKCLKK